MKVERALMHTYDGKKWSKQVTEVQIEASEFAEGAFRKAHKAVLNWGGKPEAFVVKFAKDPMTSREIYFADIEAQVYAALWAAKWNQAGAVQEVSYVPCFLLELVDRPGRPLCGCELLIDGEFEKHNNNVGAVCHKQNETEQSRQDLDMAQAFSHFTYENSNKQILICDIQGVGNLYTDPQVHTISGKGFGAGNLGNTGMSAFLLRHRCNPMCASVGLPVIHAKSLGPETPLKPSNNLPVPKLLYKGPNYHAARRAKQTEMMARLDDSTETHANDEADRETGVEKQQQNSPQLNTPRLSSLHVQQTAEKENKIEQGTADDVQKIIEDHKKNQKVKAREKENEKKLRRLPSHSLSTTVSMDEDLMNEILNDKSLDGQNA